MNEALEPRGVVVSGTGGVWRVRLEDGQTIEASLRGRLKKSNSGKRADGSLRRDTVAAAAETLKLAVGDDVRLDLQSRLLVAQAHGVDVPSADPQAHAAP